MIIVFCFIFVGIFWVCYMKMLEDVGCRLCLGFKRCNWLLILIFVFFWILMSFLRIEYMGVYLDFIIMVYIIEVFYFKK